MLVGMAAQRNLPDAGMVHVYVRVPAHTKRALAAHADRRNMSMGAVIQELVDQSITPAGNRRSPTGGKRQVQ